MVFSLASGSLSFARLRATASANTTVNVQVANTPGAIQFANTPGAIQADAVTAFKNVHFVFDVNKGITQMAAYGSAIVVVYAVAIRSIDDWKLQWEPGQATTFSTVLGVFLILSIMWNFVLHQRITNIETAIDQADKDLIDTFNQYAIGPNPPAWLVTLKAFYDNTNRHLNFDTLVLVHASGDIVQLSKHFREYRGQGRFDVPSLQVQKGEDGLYLTNGKFRVLLRHGRTYKVDDLGGSNYTVTGVIVVTGCFPEGNAPGQLQDNLEDLLAKHRAKI